MVKALDDKGIGLNIGTDKQNKQNIGRQEDTRVIEENHYCTHI